MHAGAGEKWKKQDITGAEKTKFNRNELQEAQRDCKEGKGLQSACELVFLARRPGCGEY
jgi:hypothetical protein